MDEMGDSMKAAMDAGTEGKKQSARLRGEAVNYDFKHPARVNKDQLRTMENLHDNFARMLSGSLSKHMRAVVDVDTAFVDQTTYAEFVMSLSNPSCSYQFHLGPTGGQAIIDVAMPVAFALVDRMHGGKGSSRGVDARQLTQPEMGIMARLCKDMVRNLEETWRPVTEVEISDIELETNPEFMQITAASEIVILMAFEVNSTNASGLISLCYPFFTLESILPLLGVQTYIRHGRLNRDETVAANRRRLENVYLPIRGELAAGEVSLTEVQGVQVGDVIRAETQVHEPTVLYVGDEPKFLGLPFAGKGDRFTVKISEILDPAAAERLKNRCRPVQFLRQN
jgi:flagellar motor switch protein FliM